MEKKNGRKMVTVSYPNVRRICFTLNNWNEDDYRRITSNPAWSYGIIGKEIGDSKTPHLQGYLELVKKTRWITVKKLIGARAHLEVAKGTAKQNIAYCSKDNDVYTWGEPRVNAGKRSDLDALRAAISAGKSELELAQLDAYAKYPSFVQTYKQLTYINTLKKMDLKLREWQEKILDIVLGPVHPRKVHWCWEAKGATGKTTLAKFLVRNHDAQYFSTGKHSDVAHAYNNSNIVIFDFSRTQAERIPYAILEQLKNGFMFSGKYQSATKQFEPPHVVCFANFEPDRRMLSQDRWDIHHIYS